jgi:citrate synthase
MNKIAPVRIREAWWRIEGLSAEESRLLDALCRAHYESAFRNNASSVTVANAAGGSGELTKAIAAALLTLGAKHGPLQQSVKFLARENPASEVDYILGVGGKVPGWGGTFQKEHVDPFWLEVDDLLSVHWAEIHDRIRSVTERLHAAGKIIMPNPSAYTAAVALAVRIPAAMSPYLFILGRLTAWTQIAYEHMKD